jgi:hypothetical protein
LVAWIEPSYRHAASGAPLALGKIDLCLEIVPRPIAQVGESFVAQQDVIGADVRDVDAGQHVAQESGELQAKHVDGDAVQGVAAQALELEIHGREAAGDEEVQLQGLTGGECAPVGANEFVEARVGDQARDGGQRLRAFGPGAVALIEHGPCAAGAANPLSHAAGRIVEQKVGGD